MTHQLEPVELDFFETAPTRWDFEAELAAPQGAVFAAISGDPASWTEWFPGLTAGKYHGDGPFGVGTKREIEVGGDVYRETMLAWDEPSRWTYRVDESSSDMFRALAEDWVVEARGEESTVRWTFAIDPGPVFATLLDTAPALIGGVFQEAMANLGARLAQPASA